MSLSSDPYGITRVVGHAFIEHPALWPKADSSKVCLFEAVNMVGQTLFGMEWRGNELLAEVWASSPAELDATITRNEQARTEFRAAEIVKQFQAVEKAKRASVSLSQNVSPARPSRREPQQDETVRSEQEASRARLKTLRAEVLAQDTERWQVQSAALRRLIDVVDWLSRRFRDGEVATYWRLESGGALKDLQPHEWFVDNPLFTRFAYGGFPRWSGARQIAGYIFVPRAELIHAISHIQNEPLHVSESDLSRLSPYLQFAVKVALAEGWTKQDLKAGAKKQRERAIESKWLEGMPGVPVSAPLVKMVASMTLWPDVLRIKRGIESQRPKN